MKGCKESSLTTLGQSATRQMRCHRCSTSTEPSDATEVSKRDQSRVACGINLA